MRITAGLTMLCALVLGITFAMAQRPGGGPAPGTSDAEANAAEMFNRLMIYDKNEDGKLAQDELTDERLKRLFTRADADKDGFVTKAEITTLAAKEPAFERGGPGGFGGGPGGPGGPGGFGGPGGPGRGMGGPPRPGEILNPFLQDRLELTDDQKSKLADLQKEVDAKLATILNQEQKDRLKEMRERGPFGPGGPRGGGPPPPPPIDE